MMTNPAKHDSAGYGSRRKFGSFLKSSRGNIGPLTALLLVPIIAMLGVGTEFASWYLVHRAEQNAADSAAVSAATNNANGGTGFTTEAQSVASSYGFTNGSNDTTVSVTLAKFASVPACTTKNCYGVKITKNVPMYLLPIVGYNGDVTGKTQQSIVAVAIASTKTINVSYCITSLATSGDGILINGGSNANFTNCYLRSNSNVTCNGTNATGNARGFAFSGTNKKCAPATSQPNIADPYAGQYGNVPGNIPPNTCTSYPQEPRRPHDPALPATNKLNGSYTWGANVIMCGDVQLTGNVTITSASPGTALVIENGRLDLNGHTLTSASGSGLTIVFTGPTVGGLSPTHTVSCSGTLDIAAPTSGTWSGVAIWQDKTLTSGIDLSCGGNQPTWDLQGLVYMPNANLDFSGVVDKYSNSGLACYALVDWTYQANGTDTISNGLSQCAQAGLVPPSGAAYFIGQLVY